MIAIDSKTVIAWLPVKTENKGWVWLKKVIKETDANTESYLGLLPEVKYILKDY